MTYKCKNSSDVMTKSVFDAVKTGMLVSVQTIVEKEGSEILQRCDDNGHTLAHWVCLGGHSHILRYIIEMKGPVDEPSQNLVGQRPIHWACVNGHISIVDILLQSDVVLDIQDNKGCTPLTVACQYGQTMLAGYLLGKGANQQAVDKDGDTALHWAASKGHSEVMRLLIYSGVSPHQCDNYGQTPLHLACISGSLTAVKELCEQDRVAINVIDKNGKTPLTLAVGREHHKIVKYLQMESKSRTSLIPRLDIWAILFGPPGNSKGPLLFFLLNMFLWAYPMYIFKCLPETWYELKNIHIVFMFFNVTMWIGLYHCSTVDPGYLPRNTPDYERAIKEVAHFDEWKQGHNPLSQLCHTCHTVKPMRSKHCRICNRCVMQFDHHCPYVYNCVGIRNRVSFALFVASSTICGSIGVFFCFHLWRLDGWQWLLKYVLGIPELLILWTITVIVFITTAYHAATNLTTNEHVNYRRYKYLQDAKGGFCNPYDQGYRINLLEFFHLRHPARVDVVDFGHVSVV